MKYPENSYAAREMCRRRIEARNRLKSKSLDAVSCIAIVICADALFFAMILL
jgi:hypothetical protein